MLKIRRSRDRLILNMGIPMPGKDGLYIETEPRQLLSQYRYNNLSQIKLIVKWGSLYNRNKGNTKATNYWSFVRASHRGQLYGKRLHVTTTHHAIPPWCLLITGDDTGQTSFRQKYWWYTGPLPQRLKRINWISGEKGEIWNQVLNERI